MRIFPPLVYLAGLLGGYALWWFWPVPILPGASDLVVRVAGGILAVLGLCVVLPAVILFHSIGEDPNPTKPTNVLTFDGPYRFTRNPMYLGMALVQAGLALAGNSLWPLLALIPVIYVIRTQVIDREERYLEAKFGAAYRDFKTRVRRWI